MKERILNLINEKQNITPRQVVDELKNGSGEPEVLRELIKLLAAHEVLMDEAGRLQRNAPQLANA